MPTGRSLHIGLNFVDPNHYDGWNGELKGCHNDAKDMASIANVKHFESVTLLDKNASVKQVAQEIKKAAKASSKGDIFFLTYSGHGSQMPDNGLDAWDDEPDGLDETWCLWDRQLIDDELYLLFSEFPAGVRIFMLSDSCHSGTVAKLFAPALQAAMAASPLEVGVGGTSHKAPQVMPGLRTMSPTLAIQVYKRNEQQYKQVKQIAVDASNGKKLGSQVLLISGCQDNQTSSDGDGNGLFTATFKAVWKNGNFKGSYKKLHLEIKKKMPMWQTPNLYSAGTDLHLEKEPVLSI